jgi:hypothetical protein
MMVSRPQYSEGDEKGMRYSLVKSDGRVQTSLLGSATSLLPNLLVRF